MNEVGLWSNRVLNAVFAFYTRHIFYADPDSMSQMSNNLTSARGKERRAWIERPRFLRR